MKRFFLLALCLLLTFGLCACAEKEPEPVELEPDFDSVAEDVFFYMGPDANKETVQLRHTLSPDYRYVTPAQYDRLCGDLTPQLFSLDENDVGVWYAGQNSGLYLVSEKTDEVEAGIAFVAKAHYQTFLDQQANTTGDALQGDLVSEFDYTSKTLQTYIVFRKRYDRYYVADFGSQLYVAVIWVGGDGELAVTDVVDRIKINVKSTTEA